jgi:hypothetical protein
VVSKELATEARTERGVQLRLDHHAAPGSDDLNKLGRLRDAAHPD